jgi:hypothetical protein
LTFSSEVPAASEKRFTLAVVGSPSDPFGAVLGPVLKSQLIFQELSYGSVGARFIIVRTKKLFPECVEPVSETTFKDICGDILRYCTLETGITTLLANKVLRPSPSTNPNNFLVLFFLQLGTSFAENLDILKADNML